MTASETVKRAKAKHRAPAAVPLPNAIVVAVADATD